MTATVAIPQPVDLTQAFAVALVWDRDPSFSTQERLQEVVDRFSQHALHGAFVRLTKDAYVSPQLLVSGRSAQVVFARFPFEKQALRLLARALMYVYFREHITLRVSLLASAPVSPYSGGHVVAAPRDLDATLTPAQLPFPARHVWCAKQIELQMTFYGSVPEAVVDGFDDLVAIWVLFASDGAYTSADQFLAYDEDEDVDVCVDVPTVGDDFAEWMITSYGVGGECATPLFNMMGGYPWSGYPPVEVVLERG